ncbi:MAG: hypothetical protein K2N89_04230 [Lachnospiraceae bacterium]|nr:hypothetical protein [Lachnospiraceae bacterium]
MIEYVENNTLSDFMYKYGRITVYSEHGGMIHTWERDLLKYYKDRKVVFVWVNPINCHAYIQIK